MATEFNYVANIDTTRIMGAVAEIRSQIGMALGSATGFAGGGFAGDPSATAANMLPGFGRFTPNMFGGTFTNAAISYTPHYGAMVATTSFGQEQRVFQGGLGAAAKMAPPGVSPAEYFIGSETNRINRDIEARHQAQFAARSTFYSGMGGLAAGEVASAVAFPIGAMAGGKLASRFLGGKSAIGAGKFLGGLGLGLLAYDWAMDEVGGRIQEHFANVERIGGMTRELGELAGAGRGLKRTSRYELGIAARKAAGDIKMDVQEMGDVLALGRNFGMLPNSTDPSKAREQFREFARAIDEGAQILHTSLAGAAQTIKTATSHGMTAQEGVIRAAAMGGSAAFNRYMAFGDAGGRLAEANLLSKKQGFGLFTGAIGAISGAGMTGAEMRMMGGKYGAAAMMGQTQMAAAMSPMGDMQLLAAVSGEPLGGMMDLPGAALGALGEGGDFIGNALRFQAHKREMLRGVGARGIRTMARNQIQGVADMLLQMSPTLGQEDARINAAMMTRGLNEVQAKAYVRGLSHSGGGGAGGRGAAASRAMLAMQEGMIGVTQTPAPEGGGGGVSTGKAMAAGALIGGMAIPVPVVGAAVGAAGGFLYSKWGAISDYFSGDTPSLLASAEEKADFYQRKQASEFERRVSASKSRVGIVDIDPGVAAAAYTNNLGGTRLNLNAMGSPAASARARASLIASGLKPVAAGAGTVLVGPDYFNATEVQGLAQSLMDKPAVATEAEKENMLAAAARAKQFSGTDAEIQNVGGAMRLLSHGGLPAWMQGGRETAFLSPGRLVDEAMAGTAELARRSGDKALQEEVAGGLGGPLFAEFYKRLSGEDLPEQKSAFWAGQAIAGGAQGALKLSEQRERVFVRSIISSQAIGTEGIPSAKRELSALQEQRADLVRNAQTSSSVSGAARLVDPVPNESFARVISDIDKQIGVLRKRADISSHLDTFTKSFQESDFFGRAKTEVWRAANLKGRKRERAMEEAQRLMDLAHDEAAVELPAGVTVEGIDLDKRVFKGSLSRQALGAADEISLLFRGRRIGVQRSKRDRQEAGVNAVAEGIGGLFGDGVVGGSVEGAVRQVGRRALAASVDQSLPDRIPAFLKDLLTTTPEEEIVTEGKALGAIKPKDKKRRRGAEVMSKTIGWGARENAMDSINKSLRHTQRMLANLDKKISGSNPNPAEPTPGTGNTSKGTD